MVGFGYNNQTIGDRMGISRISVEDLTNRLYYKLGVEDKIFHPRSRLALLGAGLLTTEEEKTR